MPIKRLRQRRPDPIDALNDEAPASSETGAFFGSSRFRKYVALLGKLRIDLRIDGVRVRSRDADYNLVAELGVRTADHEV